MQLADLVKPIDKQTDEELLERLRSIRHNREVVRAAVKKRVERTETKASRGRLSKMEQLLATLSPEEREAILRQVEDQSDSNSSDT